MSDVQLADYDVRYPSGATRTLRGVFRLVPLDTTMCPAILPSPGSYLLLDQRAIVTCNGAVVYSPRRNADGLGAVMTDWLKQHPEWDRIDHKRKRSK